MVAQRAGEGQKLGGGKTRSGGGKFWGGLHPPVGAVPISSEIPCGDKCLIC